MESILKQVESILETLIEKKLVRIFGSVDAEKEMIRQFIAEMKASSYIDSDHLPVAANYYSLNVPPQFFPEMQSRQSLLDRLSRHIMEAGSKAGLRFNGFVQVAIFPDKTLREGEFAVKAIVKDLTLGDTTPALKNYSPSDALQATPRAFFIIGGTQIFTIQEPIINIGRQVENDLVLHQPRVSRKHAQVRLVKGRHMIFDLDSSGGTFVNNRRVSQAALRPGDVISLAGVPLVYGHDTIISIEDTEEFQPTPIDQESSADNPVANPIQENKDLPEFPPE